MDVVSPISEIDIKDTKCAPSVSFDSNSCIRLEILVDMVRAYNDENPMNTIKLNEKRQILNPKQYKKYLLKEVRDRLKDKCTTQICWTKQTFIDRMNKKYKDELQKYTFRPNGPEGRFEWLSTFDINNVAKQYERKYSNFIYLGTVPIDFDDLPSLGIKDLNFNKLIKNGKTSVGIIFNLDKHNQSGSHWVALFFDLKECKIYFYDSYGVQPPKEIRRLMRRIYSFCELKYGKKKKIDVGSNNNRHQYGNSECGVYSINFILRLLNGETFENICNNGLTDEEINKCRTIYFNNANFK